MASVERRERRQPDWSQAGIAFVPTTDQHQRGRQSGDNTLPDFLATHLPSSEVRTLADSAAAVQQWLQQAERNFLLLTSSSHKTTGDVQEALEVVPGWGTTQRGILSFDHHSDMETIETGTTGFRITKSNVMQYVLEHNLADAVAVVGTDPIFAEDTPHAERRYRYDIVPGDELYTQEHPDPAKLLEALDGIFPAWQAKGIREVYISVDLDGLRLPEHNYTGVDYGQLGDHPYHGIPAAWIPLAMQHARRQYGLRLGVHNHRTGQRMIGDVVEYNVPDHKQHTARIAQHILGAMLAEAQRDPIPPRS